MPPKKQVKKQVEEPVVEEPPPIPPHQLSGYARFQYQGGVKYQGEWRLFDGVKLKHGQGILTIPGATSQIGHQKYQGQWQMDKMSGQGTYHYANGNIYKGHWKNNQHQGYGQYLFLNGTVYQGQWKHHKVDGTGFYIDSNGRKWQGQFRQGRFQTKIQNELKKQKQLQIRKDKVKHSITQIMNNILDALAKSDKKTLKDNMNLFFSGGESIKELVKDPYAKLEERPQEKWTEVFNILKNGKIKVLTIATESEFIGSEKILGKQLQGAGQIVQIFGNKDQRVVKAAFVNIEGNNWVIVSVQDDEKKK